MLDIKWRVCASQVQLSLTSVNINMSPRRPSAASNVSIKRQESLVLIFVSIFFHLKEPEKQFHCAFANADRLKVFDHGLSLLQN
jgi:hypothetical protein